MRNVKVGPKEVDGVELDEGVKDPGVGISSMLETYEG